MPSKRCCCDTKLCDGITGLYDTGEETSGDPCVHSYGIDLHWTANGVDAFAFNDAGGDEDDPTLLIGCPSSLGHPQYVAGITAVCADDILLKAVIEPGGIDGAETEFELTFNIASGTQLDKIAFCGKFTADNYVVAGKWLVNDVDQAHIPHGSYEDSITLGCLPFAITSDTAPLVIGDNVIKITVKNGSSLLPEGEGGPLFLKCRIFCVFRATCDTDTCKTWEAIAYTEGGVEFLEWDEIDYTPCSCYCKCDDIPPIEPEYEGQLYTSYCQELP